MILLLLMQDAPEAPGPMAAQPWQNGQLADVSKWVKSEDSEVSVVQAAVLSPAEGDLFTFHRT